MLFDNLTIYGEKWNLKDSRALTSQELGAIDRAEVVPSEYGSSVCFFMKKGGAGYIPLSRDSKLKAGDTVDPSKLKVLTLGRSGEADILRVEETGETEEK